MKKIIILILLSLCFTNIYAMKIDSNYQEQIEIIEQIKTLKQPTIILSTNSNDNGMNCLSLINDLKEKENISIWNAYINFITSLDGFIYLVTLTIIYFAIFYFISIYNKIL